MSEIAKQIESLGLVPANVSQALGLVESPPALSAYARVLSNDELNRLSVWGRELTRAADDERIHRHVAVQTGADPAGEPDAGMVAAYEQSRMRDADYIDAEMLSIDEGGEGEDSGGEGEAIVAPAPLMVESSPAPRMPTDTAQFSADDLRAFALERGDGEPL